MAVLSNNAELVEALLEHGAKIDRKTCIDGITPLMEAARYGYMEVMAVLLKNNADISIKSKNGKTALDLARNSNVKELIKSLGNQNNGK